MIRAINIPSKIKFRNIVKNLTYTKVYQSGYEVVYKLAPDSYIVLYSFGVYCLLNVSYKDEFDFKYCLKTMVDGLEDNELSDSYEIAIKEGSDIIVEHNKCTLPDLKLEYIRIISLILAQSVALDFFEENTDQILTKSLEYSKLLKNSGKYPNKRKQLFKFIGYAISTRQEILSNLYIADTPEETWNNQTLERLFLKMKDMFDIEPRFKALSLSLNSIQESVSVIVNLMQTKKSHMLEWGIILLFIADIVIHLLF